MYVYTCVCIYIYIYYINMPTPKYTKTGNTSTLAMPWAGQRLRDMRRLDGRPSFDMESKHIETK